MKPSRYLALAALLTIGLLAGCTGTSEPQAPTMLIVGLAEGGAPQLALIEDMREVVSSATPRLRFVDGSRRPLLAPAVSIDLTEREGARGSAWVLTRAVAAGAVSAYLQRFAVSDIDPADPSGFSELPGSRITLTTPSGEGVLDAGDDPDAAGSICPSVVRSSRSGGHVVVLDDPTACGFAGTDFPVMWLVNTADGSATALQGTNEVLGMAPHTDQRDRNERAYFLVGGTTSVQVFATDLVSGGSDWFQQLTLPVRPLDLIDLAGHGQSLVALTLDGLVARDLADPAAAATVGTDPPIGGARDLVVDPFGLVPQLLVMSPTQVAVYDEVEDDDPDTFAFAGAAAVIDPLMRFAYVAGEGQVRIVDLLTGLGDDDPLRSGSFPVEELTLPTGPLGRPLTVVTWVRAAEPLPTQP